MPAPRVTAAVLIVGDEILSGRTQDVNLSAIAKYLAVRGIEVAEARVVGDVQADVVAAINALRHRWDYLITTGGIGPTHDDITADCVAEAFGVPLIENEEIVAAMARRLEGEVNAARRRMARIPLGGDLIANPVQGPPGFTIGNVFVLAGVPSIMRGMLEDVGWRMKSGAVVLSATVRVEGFGEGLIAAPLEETAKAYPAMSLGSYPFSGPEGYGSNLVLRSRDADELERAIVDLIAALEAAGITSARRIDA